MGRPRKVRKTGRRPSPGRLGPNVRALWTVEHGWRYRADVMVDGQRLYGPSRAEQQEAATDAREMRQRGKDLAKTKDLLTVEDAMKLVLEQGERLGASEGTLRFYREAFAPIWRHFGGATPLHEVDAHGIEGFRAERLSTIVRRCRCTEKELECKHKGRPVTNKRVEKELTALGRIFSVAIRAKRLPPPNPVLEIERARQKPTEAPFYTAEDMAEILATLRGADTCPSARWFHDVVALLFLSGLRLGELAHLRASHVDLQRSILQVPAEGKTGERLIPLSTPLRTVLERMVAGQPADAFLLPGATPDQRAGNVKSNVFPRYRARLPERLRRGFNAHTLRHSFKSHLEEAGTPRAHSDALTGHGPRSVADRYRHASLLQLRQRMAEAFDPTAKQLLEASGKTRSAAS